MTSRRLLPGKAIWETFAVVSIKGPWRRDPERTTPVQTLHGRRWERHLRAWELWAELTNSIRVQFRYTSAQVVDRPIQRLTDAERDWITTALPRVTRQMAEIEAGSSPPRLSMGPPDLPRL
jgi:hypothetical protein